MNQLSSQRRDDRPMHAWTAAMIHPQCDQGVGTASSFVARDFDLDAVSGNETLRISAFGLYRCFINGERVGQDELTPGWTCYDKRLSYQAYSISEHLKPGANRIEIWLGDGWYRSPLMWGVYPIPNTWGDKIAAIAELHHSAGDEAPFLSTDEDWESGLIPVQKSGIYFGEIFDARVAPSATAGVTALEFDPSVLIAHETGAVKVIEVLASEKSWQDSEGRTVHDFGQNIGGFVRFTVQGNPGDTIIVEHAEILDKHGEFYNVNYRTAEARLEYTIGSDAPETYQPHFTFQGFRYARVTVSGSATIQQIDALPISSVPEPTASFTCGNELVNRLVLNTLWSQRGNFIEVPTDCPQRDERLGWTGDAQVFCGTACYLADSQGFLTKWLRDVMVDQREDGAVPHVSPDPTRMDDTHYPGFFGSTGWGDAIAIVPWQLYLHYGDKDILRETLPAMEKWVDFVWSISEGPIVSPPRAWGTRGFSFGDWLQPSGPSSKPLPTISDEASATIYLYITSTLVSQIAEILQERALAERMAKISAEVKAAFRREFVTPSGRIATDDQTSYALAILHDLVPEENIAAAGEFFENALARTDGTIGTGFIGTPALLPALIKVGKFDIAARLLLQEDVPGWLYQIKKGATTIWERWNAIADDGTIYNPRMNSYNHYAYGAVCQWLFEAVAGFSPDTLKPGFENIIFEPIIMSELSPVDASYASVRGTIRAQWTKQDDKVTYEVEVPEGSTGTLKLQEQYKNARLDGRDISTGDLHELNSGKHTVEFDYSETILPKRDRPNVNARLP